MLHKRLIGVITVKDGWAVQSIGYRRHLPLGRAETLAENLDRWGVDEIFVLCIDRTVQRRGPDWEVLRRLAAAGLATPLTFGGGIASVADAAAVIRGGAERVCLDALLRDDPAAVRAIAARIGAQALVGVLPLACEGEQLQGLEYRTGRALAPADLGLEAFRCGAIAEALVVDWRHEGCKAGFDADLLRRFPVPGVPLIAFGGISEASQIAALLEMPEVCAVAVGNFLSYRENAAARLKVEVGGERLRATRPAMDSR